MLDSSPIAEPLGYPGRPLTVAGVLHGHRFLPGRPDVRGRRPVLAFGSNADPGQLRRKFGDDVRVPVTTARLTGLRIVHSGHVSPPGYIPYTAVAGPGPARTTLVLWLDDVQLATLDLTEPNYRRTPGPLGHDLYLSRWGPLTETPSGPALAASDQVTAYRALASRPWFARVVPEWQGPATAPAALAALRADPARRDEIRRRLAAERG